MAEKTATYALNLQSNARDVAGGAASSLEQLRAKIEQSQAAVKGYSGALRSLRGSSDEVARARDVLKAKLDAEKGAISQASLALLKHGTTYAHLSEEQKKQKTVQDKLRDGVKAAGGPVQELTTRLEGMKGVLGGGHAGVAALALGMAGLVVAVAAVAAAIVDAGVKLGRFVVTGADALRNMQLLREGTGHTDQNMRNLGTQVDRIARLVPTAKEQINLLGVELVRSLSGGMSRANGQTIVATFEAVARASAAAGDSVGNTLRGLVERGKVWNRFQLAPQDLDNTGLRFEGVARALAAKLKIGLDQAKSALFTGRVSLQAGAEALRDAVNERFAGVNAKQLLSIDVQLAKARERLVGLTKGVVLEPLLRGLSKVLEQFDETSATGQRLQGIFTKIGDGLVRFSVAHVDQVVRGIEHLVAWGGRAVDIFNRWAPRISSAVTALTNNRAAMAALQAGGEGLLVVVGGIGAAFAALAAAAGVAAEAIGAPFVAMQEAYEWAKGIKWSELGKSIVGGILQGLRDTVGGLYSAITGMANKVKTAFTGALQIQSPSKVFRVYGRQTAQGYARGVGDDAPRAQRAVDAMAPAAPRGARGASAEGSSGGSSSGGAPMVIVNFNFHGGTEKNARELASAISEPSILAALTRAIRQGLITQGVQTQAVVLA